MKKVIQICVLAFAFVSATNIYATANTEANYTDVRSGDITFRELISACKEMAESLPSKFVNKEIIGKIINIKDKKYEIRYFSFEDTTKLNSSITFYKYISSKGLMDMKSTSLTPLPGIHFESFDYRKAKLGDGVYFSMALRLITEKD